MSVAVIGTGAIGSAVAGRLLAHGHEVTVWNRTGHRAVATGARTVASVPDAVLSASLGLFCLTDYAALRDRLAEAGPALDGRTVVALCTGTPADARSAAGLVTGHGGRYLDAGLQTGPDLLGTILYSGDRDAFERHRPTLALLAGPRFVGEAPDTAATWELALYGLWYDAQLGVLRALDVARRAGIDATAFSAAAATQLGHVVAALPDTAADLARGTYPAGPADLAGHLTVIGHLIEERAGQVVGDGGLAPVAARIRALLAAGRAEQGLTAVVDPS